MGHANGNIAATRKHQVEQEPLYVVLTFFDRFDGGTSMNKNHLSLGCRFLGNTPTCMNPFCQASAQSATRFGCRGTRWASWFQPPPKVCLNVTGVEHSYISFSHPF